MEQLDVNSLRDEFNRASQSVRIVTILSPTCPVCQYGQGIVRGIFEGFGTSNLKGFVVWLPMMPGDNAQFARMEAETFKEHPVVHTWDPERRLGKLYAKTLNLTAAAWDVYLLYAPGVRWDEHEPPQPTFWMHQLPGDTGADWKILLNPTKFSQELLKLLGSGVRPSRVDLGLLLHGAGLMNLLRKRAHYTLEDIRQAVEKSRVL